MSPRHTLLLTLVAVLLAAAAATASGLDGPAGATSPGPVPPSARADRPGAYMVQLAGDPAATVSVAQRRRGASSATAASSARAQRGANGRAQERILDEAEDRGLVDAEIFRVATVYNGVAVIATAADAKRIAAIDGVRSVTPLPQHTPTNDRSVPYIGAPGAWQSGALGSGDGVKVGVIDTGIDYVHKDFGGRGTPGDLTAARGAAANPETVLAPGAGAGFTVQSSGQQIYPTPKVVGGWDFAGDGYNSAGTGAALVPHPDPNPIDCPVGQGDSAGHGSHVAGTIGGLGVTAAGNTYAGTYDAGTPTATMKIGPGVAPGVDLYALRVFGCNGSTALAIQAMDWALDPNRDGNPADHLDVVNLSLGSDFGTADTADAVALNNLAAAGVIVVASAGNGGDQTFQSGSPGSAPRALTVANMVSGIHRDAFRVSGASEASGANGVQEATESVNYPWTGFSPVTAPLYRPATNQTGCSTFSGGEPAAMAGKIVLLDWTTTPGGSSPCGSTIRANNVQATNAAGVIMADPSPTHTTLISASFTIPAVYTIGGVRDKLLAALADGGATITIDHGLAGTTYDTRASETVSTDSSRGPTAGAGLKPDIAAPGTSIRSVSSGGGDASRVLNGTSMAAPHAAGAMAILRAAHPTWTVEELKALAMNTARPDLYVSGGHTGAKYPPQRVGAGVVDLESALADQVVAYDDSGTGTVGVSFGPLEVPVGGGAFTRDRTIRVKNRSGSPIAYTASFDSRSTVTGVSWDFPDGATVTVPANGETTFRVRLRVDDPSALRNSHDPTLAEVQNNGATRTWRAEASGLVRLTAGGHPTLSVPTYASVRPATDMSVTTHDLALDAATGSGSLTLTGSGGPNGTTRNDFASVLTPLELQYESPEKPPSPVATQTAKGADIRYVGVGPDTSARIMFGITTWGRFAAPSEITDFEVILDTDGVPGDDYIAYASRQFNADAASDVFAYYLYRISNSSTALGNFLPLADGGPERGFLDSDSLILPVRRSSLGLDPVHPRFTYRVVTFARGVSGAYDETPELTWEAPGVSFPGTLTRPDQPGSLNYGYDRDMFAANGSLGALLIHHLNATGDRAEVVRMAPEASPTAVPGGPYAVDEGQPATFDGSGSSDPNGEDLSYEWDADGDGTYELAGASPTTAAFPDGPAAPAAKLRVSDGHTDPVVASVPVTVNNVAPTAAASITGDGKSKAIHVSATDPSPVDTAAGLTLRVDVGADGSIDLSASGTTASDFTYAFGPGDTPVQVTAVDKDGGVSAPVDLVASVPRPDGGGDAGDGGGPGPAIVTPPVLTPPAVVPPVVPPGLAPPTRLKPAAKRCVVPNLKGKTLAATRAALRKANCALGKVTKPKRAKGALVVASQTVKAKATRRAGTKVGVRLAAKKKAKRKR